MKRTIFGTHLYTQIVWPLVLAAALAGVLVAFLAVYFLDALTGDWVARIAEGSVRHVASVIDSKAESMRLASRMVAVDAQLREALGNEDAEAARGALARLNTVAGYDAVSVLRPDGTVFSSTGVAAPDEGTALMGHDGRPPADSIQGDPRFLDTDVGHALSVSRPMQVGEVPYLLTISQVCADEMLAGLADEAGDAFALIDTDGALIASRITTDPAVEPEQRRALARFVQAPSATVLSAIEQARDGRGFAEPRIGESAYFVLVEPFVSATGRDESNSAYIVAYVSRAASDQATATTRNLMVMWTLIALLVLVGLAVWVARRVSDPIVALTDGARRIASGDFSARTDVGGHNELTELSETFNQMTESLRDRSDSLTKKVLELASLYEMSRSLGSTLDMDVLLDSVLDAALRIFEVDLGYVTLRDRDSGALVIRAWRGGVAARPGDDSVRHSISEWVVREGRPLVFNPSRTPVEGHADVLTGATSALCVPLVSAEGTIGAITVGTSGGEFRFLTDDVRLLSTIANHVAMAVGNIELFSSLQDAYLATVRSLAVAVDAKDPFTRGHSDNVAKYATLIAEKMGLSVEQRTALEMAAFLHDIGKIGVKEGILLKPGSLTDEEMAQMRHHPLIGANILKPVGFPWPITPIVRHHHERYDGAGYPAGLKGEEIPLLARVLSVADAYEAMIADRPYRRGRSESDAIIELKGCAGRQFDPVVVDAFVALLSESGSCLIAAEDVGEPLQYDEAEAAFVAMVEGALASFSRLSGPRLAANVEAAVNLRIETEGLSASVEGGRVVRQADGAASLDIDQMRRVLRCVSEAIGEASGFALVDHFYADATAGLSERMRKTAHDLTVWAE